MAASYIPPKDADLVNWCTNFSDLITADPPRYGLDAAAALLIQGAADDYNAAYAAAVNPTTRTPVTVSAKDSAKIAGVALWRTYAAQIRINPGVLNADKIALGLNLPNNSPSPVPAPTSFPLLTQISSTPLASQWSYADSDTPVGKAKAPGATALQLFVGYGTVPITDPEALLFAGLVTKSPFLLEFPVGEAGKIATVGGRWSTRRGLLGPWSSLSTTTVVNA